MLKYQNLISQMTLEEKCYLLSGKDLVSRIWQCLTDFMASESRKGQGDQLGLNGSVLATCFPMAATMANSWDLELGKCLGENAACQNVDVLLGLGW